MTYRLDPEIEERLSRLVAGLPAEGGPPASAELAARLRRTRTTRWILIAAPTFILASVLLAGVWVGHVTPLPSSAVLRCTDVDPFRCHDSAARGAALANYQAGVGSGAARGLAQSPTFPFTIVEIDVRRTAGPRTACDIGPCPAAIAQMLRQITGFELVTILYRNDRPAGGASTGSIDLLVTHYRDGHAVVAPRP